MTWTPECRLSSGWPTVQFYWHQKKPHLVCNKQGRFFFHADAPNMIYHHNEITAHLFPAATGPEHCNTEDRTWAETQTGFFSCLPPPSHPPGKARWCSHWSAGPARKEGDDKVYSSRKLPKYILKYSDSSVDVMQCVLNIPSVLSIFILHQKKPLKPRVACWIAEALHSPGDHTVLIISVQDRWSLGYNSWFVVSGIAPRHSPDRRAARGF